MKRFRAVNPQWYVDMLRFAYRLACFPSPVDGRAIPDLADRYPTAAGTKSPPVRLGAIRDLIRRELGLQSHVSLRAKHTVRFLERRERCMRDGKRSQLLDPHEIEMILPPWALEAIAHFLEAGANRSKAVVESFAREFAEGKDDFQSKKRSDEPARHVPTPGSVMRVGDVCFALFKAGSEALRNEYGDASPAWLKQWPGDWSTLAIHPSEDASAKRRQRTEVQRARRAMARADAIIAEAFTARFGRTDLEIAREPATFWKSFDSVEHAQRWLRHKDIIMVIRDRAIAAVSLVVGERQPELSSLRRESLVLDGFTDQSLVEHHGVLRGCGALYFPASEKTKDHLGAHYQPIPLEVCDRLRVMLLLYEVLLTAPIAPTMPLFLATPGSRKPPRGLMSRGVGAAAMRILGLGNMDPHERISLAFNAIRRFSDSVILENFDEWRRDVDGVLEHATAAVVKEALLSHTRIPLDPYTYSGLSDADGRLLLSYYGAEVIGECVFGVLGTRRGPDRAEIRSELATIRGLQQADEALLREQGRIGDYVAGRGARPEGLGEGDLAVSGRLLIISDQGRRLERMISAHRQRVTRLMESRRLWVEIETTERQLKDVDLEAIEQEFLGQAAAGPRARRDFGTIAEVAAALAVSVDTVAGWITNQHPESISKMCPWVGTPPAWRPNQRTVLLAIGAFRRERVNPDAWDRLLRIVATWPSARGWDEPGGAKTLTVRGLKSPVDIPGPGENDLLTERAADFCQVFRFESD